MPRKKSERVIRQFPSIRGMSVTGVRGRPSGRILLLPEEYEAIRLLDYQLLNQEAAAHSMQVSRPTLTRIYEQARRKVARAFVEGRSLVFDAGNVETTGNWYYCRRCKWKFSAGDQPENHCPKCQSAEIVQSDLG